MPTTTEPQSSFLGRISIRRNQFMNMDGNHDQEDLELFQRHIADRFSDLVTPPTPQQHSSDEASTTAGDPMLSISWLRKLLDMFLCCEAEFKALLIMGNDPSQIAKPPLDRLVMDMLERAVKALDICNAITNGIETVRHYQKLAEIAVSALEQRPYCDGPVRRAKKAVTLLLMSMASEDKEASGVARTWSFGRKGNTQFSKERSYMHLRTHTWTVSKNWSAAKQVQAMSANLQPPRGNEATGLASSVFMMCTVTFFVMWALVAAIPCQERNGLANHFPVPKQLVWAQSMIGL